MDGLVTPRTGHDSAPTSRFGDSLCRCYISPSPSVLSARQRDLRLNMEDAVGQDWEQENRRMV